MSLEAINIPRIVWRKDSSISINWELVFPPVADNSHLIRGTKFYKPQVKKSVDDNESKTKSRIYELRIQNAFDEWRVIYWGRKTEIVVSSLQPCTCYNFKVKLVKSEENSESHWLEFKAATNIEQLHVHHLTRAIKYSKIPQIRKIITSRAYLLETPNVEDKTPLIQATENADLHVITFLCNLGAKINAQSLTTHQTPLMSALFNGFVDIASYFMEKNANINLKDVNDRTALHYAVDSNNLESVKFALSHGAMLNARDNKGWTPLLRAVILEVQDEIIKLLLRKGSDRSAVDRRGLDFTKHLELTNRSQLLKYQN